MVFDYKNIPSEYLCDNQIERPLSSIKSHFIKTTGDFSYTEKLSVDSLPRMDFNPFGFQFILDKIDRLPVTDLNLDIVVLTDDSVAHTEMHVVENRLAIFTDNDLSAFSKESLISEVLDPNFLMIVLKAFLKYHSSMTEELMAYVVSNPIKIKFIKTISEEAVILLYKASSSPKDEPLCGVHFDIALSSLAPISVIETPIFD